MTDRLSTLTHALRQAGMRLTSQRVAICSLLVSAPTHPTAQALYEALHPRYPSLSLATVYHTLQALVEVGAINEIGTAGDTATHYDADLSPHVNLACTSCHRVMDLPSEHIQHVAQEVESASGYHLLGARVLYYGLCPDCQANH